MSDLSGSNRLNAEMEGGSLGEVPVEHELEIVEENEKPNANTNANASQDQEGGIDSHSVNTAGSTDKNLPRQNLACVADSGVDSVKPNSSPLSQTRRRGKNNGQGLLKLFDEKFPLKKKTWSRIKVSYLLGLLKFTFNEIKLKKSYSLYFLLALLLIQLQKFHSKQVP